MQQSYSNYYTFNWMVYKNVINVEDFGMWLCINKSSFVQIIIWNANHSHISQGFSYIPNVGKVVSLGPLLNNFLNIY